MYIYFFTLLLCSLPCFASDDHTIQPVPTLLPIKQDSITLEIPVYTLQGRSSNSKTTSKTLVIHNIPTNTKLAHLNKKLNAFLGKGGLLFNRPHLLNQQDRWILVLHVYKDDTLETLNAKNLIPNYANMQFRFTLCS